MHIAINELAINKLIPSLKIIIKEFKKTNEFKNNKNRKNTYSRCNTNYVRK